MKSVWNVYYWLTETCAKSSVFTVVMYVEISTKENMAFQRNDFFLRHPLVYAFRGRCSAS